MENKMGGVFQDHMLGQGGLQGSAMRLELFDYARAGRAEDADKNVRAFRSEVTST